MIRNNIAFDFMTEPGFVIKFEGELELWMFGPAYECLGFHAHDTDSYFHILFCISLMIFSCTYHHDSQHIMPYGQGLGHYVLHFIIR